MLDGMMTDVTMMLAQAGAPGWMTSLWSVLLLVLGFSLVIFVHELGHFLAAKWAGVRVERFAIGFGTELFGFTWGETRYSFNVLPLGGYVKMLGQEDFVVDKSGELKVKDDPDSFSNKPVGKRMVIISAGVIMNLLFAGIAFAIVVMVGRWVPPAVVGIVKEGEPGANAGLRPGDVIKAVNGDEIDTFSELTSKIVLSDPGETLEFTIERDGRVVEPKPKIRPRFVEDESVRQVGIGPGMNLRVAIPSIMEVEEPLAHELQALDELHQLVRDGEPQTCDSISDFQTAVVRARGRPVDAVVKRPIDRDAITTEQLVERDPQIPSDLVPVKLQALWFPIPFERGAKAGSLLGLVPRLRVIREPEPTRSFGLAGVKSGDVVVAIGSVAYPSYAELVEVIQAHDGEKVPLLVQRPRAANHGLSWEAVYLCAQNREALITAAREGVEAVVQLLRERATDGPVDQAQIEKIVEAIRTAGNAPAMRRWLERVDVHELSLEPKAPFALLGDTKPTIDAELAAVDEWQVMVADVVPTFGKQQTPAKAAGVPRGSVIVEAAGEPIQRWYELSEVFATHAGETVPLKLRIADELRTVEFAVPRSVHTTLELPDGARIVEIDGKRAADVAFGEDDGEPVIEQVFLPDWRAKRQLLADAVGRTLPIVYIEEDGDRIERTYAVTTDNFDPWPDRVQFMPQPVICYPLLIRQAESNPVLAMAKGFEQAYQTTWDTIQSIRHIVVTNKVGVNKISGPVGIFRYGAKFAEGGVIELLFFLGLISANLAVINFLPMPIVDGGLFLFLILEKIRGEPVSIKTQVATQLVGIALIATLFILVTYQDIVKWVTGAA